MAYVTIHKDLANIKAKVLFGLTGRQIVCFGAAVAIGVSLFFLLRTAVGASAATVWMVLAMLPFFLFAMYERNGQPLEVFLKHMVQAVFVRPKIRIYQTANVYAEAQRQDRLWKEVQRILAETDKKNQA